ncbi:MAG: integrase core domain-containing protein [Opitutales bacterium]
MKSPHPFKIIFLLSIASWISKEKSDIIAYLLEANKILKAKLEVDGKRIKFSDKERAILARKGKKLRWKTLGALRDFLTPETIIRWHNKLIAKKYTAKKHNPSKAKKTREFVVQTVCDIAKDNPSWGAGRVRGALKHLGIMRSKSCVYRIMQSNGFDPLPSGGTTKTNASWLKFLKSHLHLISCGDFLIKEVWTPKGLVRYMIFFAMNCASKRVKIVHISNEFYGAKMERLALNIADKYDGFLKDKKYFFCDKDVLYTENFRKILKDRGVEVRQVPSPICNPYAERFVKSIKTECLNHLIMFNENMLRKAVNEYVEHYNTERPHQSLDDELVSPEQNIYKEHLDLTKSQSNAESKYISEKNTPLIVKKTRLGGLLNFYYRKAI